MRRTRPFTLAAATAAALVATVSGAGDPPYHMGYVTMQDGARIPYVVYLPRAEGRFPVLFTYNPYAGGGAGPALAREYLDQGYAVMSASLRGTGCSSGRHEFQSPTIAADGAALVEWAAAQPWSDGNVGMFGNSYAGMTQLMVAGARPPHLRAIAPGASVSRLYDDIFYPGGIFNYGQAAIWTYDIQPRSAARGAAFRTSRGDAECAGLLARQEPQQMFETLRAHPRYDAWWADKSVERDAARLEVPVLLFHAWQDQQIAVSASIDLFRAIRAPKRLVLSNGGHSFYGQEPVPAALRRRWFERWLKGVRNGVDEEPAVQVLLENRRTDGVWKAAWTWAFARWPDEPAGRREWVLGADGTLEEAPAVGAGREGTREYVFPLGTVLTGDEASFQAPPSPVGSLAYRTPPLTEDVAVLGAPELTLHLSSELADTDLMAVLQDVAPSGDVLYLQRGFLRASRRTRGPGAGGGTPPSHESEEPLVPGAVHELTVRLYPLGHVLRAGHRLELQVLAPPGVPSTHWALATRLTPGRNRVHHGGRYRSRLVLPILPGRRAEAEPPPCGSLEQQPCRRAPRPGGP